MLSTLHIKKSIIQVSFTGVWSRNTHPRLYPENDWVPRYSDIVGASHAPDLILWAPGSLASDGLKDVAEHANTSKFEAEIREKVSRCTVQQLYLNCRFGLSYLCTKSPW